MLQEHTQQVKARGTPSSYDEEFFDAMLQMFMGIGRGEVGKYMYDRGEDAPDNNLWEEIV